MNVIYFNYIQKGGSGAYAEELARRLQPKIYVKNRLRPARGGINMDVPLYNSGLKFLLLSVFYVPYLWLRLVRLSNQEKVTTVYWPYIHYWTLPLCIFFKLFGFKNVITVHDGLTGGKNQHSVMVKVYRFVRRFCDGEVFLTNYVRDMTQRSFDKELPSVVSPHGPIGTGKVNYDLYTGNGPLKCLFFGKVLPSKGVEILVEAVGQFGEGASLRVAGKCHYEIELSQDKYPNVALDFEYIAEEDIQTYFEWAHIVVLPYLSASQSGVGALARNWNVPVMASRVGGLQEQFGPDEAIWVDPTVESIREALASIVKEPQCLRSVRQNMMSSSSAIWDEASASVSSFVHELIDE